MRFVLSTIGTSILTNLIDRADPAEGTWWGMLRDLDRFLTGCYGRMQQTFQHPILGMVVIGG